MTSALPPMLFVWQPRGGGGLRRKEGNYKSARAENNMMSKKWDCIIVTTMRSWNFMRRPAANGLSLPVHSTLLSYYYNPQYKDNLTSCRRWSFARQVYTSLVYTPAGLGIWSQRSLRHVSNVKCAEFRVKMQVQELWVKCLDFIVMCFWKDKMKLVMHLQ